MLSTQQLESGFVARLTRPGLLRASGEDAVSFIHGQLSNDIENLGPDAARFAGYCTPDGRLLATLLAWKSGDDVCLVMPKEILPAISKRLQMYILRSKVKLEDISENVRISGISGKIADEPSPVAVYRKTGSASGTLVRLPDAFGNERFLHVAPADAAPFSPSPARPEADDEAWELAETAAGIPQIYAATQGAFVPQMVNMELTDGMSFSKGCYPGQEIIARTQHRGVVKRRMILARADVPGTATAPDAGIVPGMDVFDAASPNAPCGMLVRAARRDSASVDCLVVLSRDLFHSGSLHLGSAGGRALHPGSLPYALPEAS